MYRYDVLTNQWLFMALGCGAALVMATVMTYVSIWRPRESEDGTPLRPDRLPLILIVFIIVVFAAWVVYPPIRALVPPNW